MTLAIYYHPEAYSTSGPKLMGRNAAGESFLQGLISYSSTQEFWAQVQSQEHASNFAEQVKKNGRSEPVKVFDKGSLGILTKVGLLYFPGPSIGDLAFQRAAYGHGAWSLCGITHTTSSAGAMDDLSNLLTAPVQPWDAVMCTSKAVKENVNRLLQANVEYLSERLGITKLVLPQLPVIPLGIHTKEFTCSNMEKFEARHSIGVGDDKLVVLYMGRLSFHAKAHPLAMYQALELAAQQTGKKVVLIECGWHANDFIAKAYKDAANLACPSVQVQVLDGRNTNDRKIAWASADIFCSLSDNIQETFGIAPVEAMAAGIPVVVSDWNGYKDTVRHGVDGFLIPTLMPEAGLGNDLALRHAQEIDTYDMYCGHNCSLVAVDIEATKNAFIALFQSSHLRKKMGESGRERALSTYDWKNIIGQYERLWQELSELRLKESQKLKTLTWPWPARMNSFHAFGNYSTHKLKSDTFLELVDSSLEIAINRTHSYRSLAMIDFARFVVPVNKEINSVLEIAAKGPIAAIDLLENIDVERKPFVFRGLVWLLKMGVLKVS